MDDTGDHCKQNRKEGWMNGSLGFYGILSTQIAAIITPEEV